MSIEVVSLEGARANGSKAIWRGHFRVHLTDLLLREEEGGKWKQIKGLYRRCECFMLMKQYWRAIEDLTKLNIETPLHGRFLVDIAQLYGFSTDYHAPMKD